MTLPPVSIDVDANYNGTGFDKAAEGIDKVSSKAAGATAKTSKFGSALSGLGNVSGGTRAKIQNTAFQLQDITVQLQNNTRASTVLAQQLPQLLGGFGAVGAVAGVLAGVTIPLVSAAINAAKGSSEDYETALETLGEALENTSGLVELLTGDADALTEAFGSNREEFRELLSVYREVGIRELADQARELTVALAGNYDGWLLNRSRAEDLASSFDFTTEQTRELAYYLQELSQADTLQDQITYATVLQERFRDIAGEVESMTDAELEFYLAMVETQGAIQKVIDHTKDLNDATIEGGNLALIMADRFFSVAKAISASSDAAGGLEDRISSLSDRAATAALNMWEIAKANAAFDASLADGTYTLKNAYVAYGASRSSAPDEPVKHATKVSSGGKSDAKRLREDLAADLEVLLEGFQTREEAELASFAASKVILKSALDQKLLTQLEYQEAAEKLAKEHAEKMTGIDAYKNGDVLDQTSKFFGDLATATASGNGKIADLHEKAAAIETSINSARAFAQALADPSIPFWGKITAGLSLVSAISSMNSSSGISSSGGASAASAAESASAQTASSISISLVGDDNSSFSIHSVEHLFEILNQGKANGHVYNVSRV